MKILKKTIKTSDKDYIIETNIDFSNLFQSYKSLTLKGIKGYYSKVPLWGNRLLIYQYCKNYIDKISEFPEAKFLVLGGGGGSIPIYILRKAQSAKVTVVEVDSTCIEIFKKYFVKKKLQKKRLKFINGCAENIEWGERYQFVFCDLFEGEKVAKCVADYKFIERLALCLCVDGICIINYGKTNNINEVVLKKYFKHVILKKENSTNQIAICLKSNKHE